MYLNQFATISRYERFYFSINNYFKNCIITRDTKL